MDDRFKFRAWDALGEKMWPQAAIGKDGGVALYKGKDFSIGAFGRNGLTVMQCTGLADYDGKLIYEGDIVKGTAIVGEGGFTYCGWIEWNHLSNLIGWYIQTDSGGWELKQAQAKISLDNITGKIIGNIYENPALLEECK